MKKYSLIGVLLVVATQCFSQAQVVMNNDGYIVISNGAYLVLGNSNANAITQTGTGGRIISEAENNRVRWNVSNATGAYTVPFYEDGEGIEIPVTATITAGGTAGATNRIDFSTYDGASFDNALYMPSGVTNMGNVTVPAANNSAQVIDRFWILDANHATKPAVSIDFTYIDAEWSAVGNTLAEANLKAQRWNTTAADWDGFLYAPTGTVNTATNVVTGVIAPAADFFKAWTLVDFLTPLPIELLSNESTCNDKNVVIKWTTASETNNDYFTIERSLDGINFTAIGIINGSGNSNNVLHYSFTDFNSFNGISYYRLKQTDYNGENKTFSIITAENCNSAFTNVNAFNNQNGAIAIAIDGESADVYTAILFDAQGKQLTNQVLSTAKGSNTFHLNISNINAGIYFLTIDNGNAITSKKILID
jgi:Secretion system C-terminal sorting domain